MSIPPGIPPVNISTPTVSGSGDAGSGVDHAVNINVASPNTPASLSVPWVFVAIIGVGFYLYYRGRK